MFSNDSFRCFDADDDEGLIGLDALANQRRDAINKGAENTVVAAPVLAIADCNEDEHEDDDEDTAVGNVDAADLIESDPAKLLLVL